MVMSYLTSIASALRNLAANGILRGAEESFGERNVDDSHPGLSLGVGRSEFPSRQQGLTQVAK